MRIGAGERTLLVMRGCVAALGAEAQQAPKVFRIGVLSLTRFIE